jgi:hypothetical protein
MGRLLRPRGPTVQLYLPNSITNITEGCSIMNFVCGRPLPAIYWHVWPRNRSILRPYLTMENGSSVVKKAGQARCPAVKRRDASPRVTEKGSGTDFWLERKKFKNCGGIIVNG